MDSVTLLNLGLVLSTILLAGIAGLSRTRIADLRADNADLRGSRDDARSDRAEIVAERDLCMAELARRESEIKALGRVVTGEAHLANLEALLTEHDRKAEAAWADILRRLRDNQNEAT